MIVLENTSDRLILEHVPWKDLIFLIAFAVLFVAVAALFIFVRIYVGALLFFAIGVALPLLGIYLRAERSQLIFDRKAQTVSHRRRGFKGMVRQDFALPHVKRAYVAKKGADMAQIFIEVTQGMDAGHHAFPKGIARLKPVLAAQTALTEWLAQDERP